MLPSDLTALATFLAVAEERSFTKAAKRRGVSPSAISHAMRTLEEELGVRLLARTTRSVALTEAGEQLVGRLKPALTDVGRHLTTSQARETGLAAGCDSWYRALRCRRFSRQSSAS
jgi:DNA-binding transcriptional LysR family regulator